MPNPYPEPVYTANNSNGLNPTPREVDVLQSIDNDLNGSSGGNYSSCMVALPNVGANFGLSGPYASYYLTAVIPAGARKNGDIENNTGSQIAVIRDDGTAASGSAPNGATVFTLGGGLGIGSQGGSYSSQTFKGRLQIYSPITTVTAATSGTLNAAWTGPTNSFYVTFSNGTPQLASFTNGSTSVTWPNAVTATASANTATAQIAAFID
jgi:hypothetical protein